MRDIGALCGGVHASTVSLALRNFPGVSPLLRKRIQAVARKLGYRPDPLLAAFNSHRISTSEKRNTRVLALVVDMDTREQWLEDRRQQLLWTGARAAALGLHAKLELFLLGQAQMSDRRLNSILLARGITGVIVAPTGRQRAEMALDWEQFSAVKIEGEQLPQPQYQIAVDHRQTTRRAWLKLRSLGYRRIGLLCPETWDFPGRELLLSGYALESSRLADQLRVPLFLQPVAKPAAVSTWVIRNRIDAVVSPLAEGLRLLKAAGLEVPSQLAFAQLQLCTEDSGVAGMYASYQQLGALAVDQVITLLRTNQRGAPLSESCTYVPASWRDGASCLSQ